MAFFYVKLASDHGLSISTHVQTLWFYDFICGHFFEIILLIRLELSRGKYSRIGHSESIRLNRIKNHHLRRFDPSCGFIKEVRYKPKEFRNQKRTINKVYIRIKPNQTNNYFSKYGFYSRQINICIIFNLSWKFCAMNILSSC